MKCYPIDSSHGNEYYCNSFILNNNIGFKCAIKFIRIMILRYDDSFTMLVYWLILVSIKANINFFTIIHRNCLWYGD